MYTTALYSLNIIVWSKLNIKYIKCLSIWEHPCVHPCPSLPPPPHSPSPYSSSLLHLSNYARPSPVMYYIFPYYFTRTDPSHPQVDNIFTSAIQLLYNKLWSGRYDLIFTFSAAVYFFIEQYFQNFMNLETCNNIIFKVFFKTLSRGKIYECTKISANWTNC